MLETKKPMAVHNRERREWPLKTSDTFSLLVARRGDPMKAELIEKLYGIYSLITASAPQVSSAYWVEATGKSYA